MDADTLRIILAVLGALILGGLYLWERRRHSDNDDDASRQEDPEGEEARADGGAEHWLGDWQEQDGATLQSAAGGAQAGFVGRSEAEASEGLVGASDFSPGPLILQLYVVPRGEPFDGAALVRAADRCGLEPGEMDIFHCTLGEGGDEDVQTLFSMANMVKPGTFPFGAMADFQSPGLTLFAQLDGTPDDPGRMEEMLGTAHSLAEDLGGELRDEGRRPLTAEAEQRLRARVMAFIERRLAQAETR
jgi:cell division protein ZipA